jgi:ABC-type transporter lipoprotein component MlaA
MTGANAGGMVGSMIRKRVGALFRPFLLAVALLCIVSPVPVRAETEGALELLNRHIFEMNKGITQNFVQPAMAAYKSQVPGPARQTIRAIYDNLLEPVTATAYTMVGDIEGAAASTTRFAVNSTLGVLGVFDVASHIGLPKQEKGFSEAVCEAGLPIGPYVVLPVIGSTTTGIAAIAATLMVGSTVALSFLSFELALVSAGVDAIEIAATLQNAFQTEDPADPTYDAERQRFLGGLAKDCAGR